MELKRVVVTGLGAITPLGLDVETTWSNALKGVSGAGPITHFDATLFKTQFACEVKGFEPTNYLLDPEDRKELKEFRRNDLYAQYALAAAKQALTDEIAAATTLLGEADKTAEPGLSLNNAIDAAQALLAGAPSPTTQAVPAAEVRSPEVPSASVPSPFLTFPNRN